MKVVLSLSAILGPLALCAAASQGSGGLGEAQKSASSSPVATMPGIPGSYQGGSDDCATPTAITGGGTYPFDLTTATTGTTGQSEPLCIGTGGRDIEFDVWFEFTATGDGLAILDTCNQTTVDTKIAVYPGDMCPAANTALACNDDGTCLNQTELTWAVAAGSTYMIQVGVWPGAQAGSGTFTILADSGPPGDPFCDCDDGGPCGNNGDVFSGCGNGTFAGGATLSAVGVPTIGTDALTLTVAQSTPSQPGLFFQGVNAINNGNGVAFGDGLRCAGQNVIRLEIKVADSNGDAATTVDIATEGGVAPGDTRHYQFWYRDPALSPCGTLFNLSNGWTITWI